MIHQELKEIFDGQDVDGDVDVDAVLAAFDRLNAKARVQDIPELLRALQSPRNNFWTRELLADPVARLGGVNCLEELLDAFEKNREEGHDNDGFIASLVDLAERDKVKCRARLTKLIAAPAFPHKERARWLLGFCR